MQHKEIFINNGFAIIIYDGINFSEACKFFSQNI